MWRLRWGEGVSENSRIIKGSLRVLEHQSRALMIDFLIMSVVIVFVLY